MRYRQYPQFMDRQQAEQVHLWREVEDDTHRGIAARALALGWPVDDTQMSGALLCIDAQALLDVEIDYYQGHNPKIPDPPRRGQ